MSAPLAVSTRDGAMWTKRTVLADGTALYALAEVCRCPEFVMATLATLAEHGVTWSGDVLPEPQDIYDRLIGANLSLYEEERENARLRLALESARRGRRAARAEVAALREERHRTNEWADDAAKALRRQRDRITKLEAALAAERLPYRERAEQEASPARREAWLRLAAAEESERVHERLLAAPADDDPAEGDGITRRIAPTQALRDDEPAGYPPALPWAALMDADDLEGFFEDLVDAASGDDDLATLTEVESAIARWRAIGEAQHAHNTAPGPDAAEAGDES